MAAGKPPELPKRRLVLVACCNPHATAVCWTVPIAVTLIQVALVAVRHLTPALHTATSATCICGVGVASMASFMLSSACLALATTNLRKRDQSIAVANHAAMNLVGLFFGLTNTTFVPSTPSGLHIPVGLLVLCAAQPIADLESYIAAARLYGGRSIGPDVQVEFQRAQLLARLRSAAELATVAIRWFPDFHALWLLWVADLVISAVYILATPATRAAAVKASKSAVERFIVRSSCPTMLLASVLIISANAGYIYGLLSAHYARLILVCSLMLRVGYAFGALIISFATGAEHALTEREAQAFRQQLRQQEERIRERHKQLRYVCHELRVPLQSIVTGLQLMLEDANATAAEDAARGAERGLVPVGGRPQGSSRSNLADAEGSGRASNGVAGCSPDLQQRGGLTFTFAAAGDAGAGAAPSYPLLSPRSQVSLQHHPHPHAPGLPSTFSTFTKLDAWESLQLMVEAAQNMVTTVSDLLDLAKAENGALQLTMTPFDLPRFVERAVTMVLPYAHKDSVSVSMRVGPGVPRYVHSDELLLGQALVNFLSNAIKFVDHGGAGHVAVTVEVEPRIGMVGGRLNVPGDEVVCPQCGLEASLSESAGLKHEAVCPASIGAAEGSGSGRGGNRRNNHRSAGVSRAWRAPRSWNQSDGSDGVPPPPTAPRVVIEPFRCAPSAGNPLGDTVPAPTAAVGAAAAAASPSAPAFPPARGAGGTALQGGDNQYYHHATAAAVQAPAVGAPTATSALSRGVSVDSRSSASAMTAIGGLADPRSVKAMAASSMSCGSNGSGAGGGGGGRLRQSGGAPSPSVGYAAAAATGAAGAGAGAGATSCTGGGGGKVIEGDGGTAYLTTGCTVAVRLTVKDNGPGIEPDVVPALYHAFAQLEAGRSYRGRSSGLGLAITREVISKHGGRVGVASQPGAGSDFFMIVPLQTLEPVPHTGSANESKDNGRTQLARAAVSADAAAASALHEGAAHGTEVAFGGSADRLSGHGSHLTLSKLPAPELTPSSLASARGVGQGTTSTFSMSFHSQPPVSPSHASSVHDPRLPQQLQQQAPLWSSVPATVAATAGSSGSSASSGPLAPLSLSCSVSVGGGPSTDSTLMLPVEGSPGFEGRTLVTTTTRMPARASHGSVSRGPAHHLFSHPLTTGSIVLPGLGAGDLGQGPRAAVSFAMPFVTSFTPTPSPVFATSVAQLSPNLSTASDSAQIYDVARPTVSVTESVSDVHSEDEPLPHIRHSSVWQSHGIDTVDIASLNPDMEPQPQLQQHGSPAPASLGSLSRGWFTHGTITDTARGAATLGSPVSHSLPSTDFVVPSSIGHSHYYQAQLPSPPPRAYQTQSTSASLAFSSLFRSPSQSQALVGQWSPAPVQPLHILVVDDVKSNRYFLAILLKRLVAPNAIVEEADDGSVAVQLVKSRGCNAFDIIALDFEMPVSGPVAAEQMRTLGCTALIVGVTGNALQEDIDLFVRSGADHVLTKPVDKAALKYILDKQYPAAASNRKF